MNEDNEDQDHNSEYDSEYESGFESREAPKDNATSRVARLPGVFGIGFETPSTFDLHSIVKQKQKKRKEKRRDILHHITIAHVCVKQDCRHFCKVLRN